MKKYAIILCVIILLSLCACTPEQALQEPVAFYYPKAQVSYGTADGAITFELRESASLQNIDLLSLYLKGPVGETLAQPFPENVDIMHFQFEDQEALLVLSDNYATLSGLSLSVANACLAKTVMELTTADTVSISCESKPLDGETVIILSKQSLILFDESISDASSNTSTEAPNVQ